LLESQSFPTKLVNIPSISSSVPLTSNEPDISAPKTVLEGLLDEGKKVFIVINSYGITPACEVVRKKGF
jgi:hypothetical protein